MKNLFVSLATASVLFSMSAQADLLLYDPFDYTAGGRLGGSGTSPLGQIAPNGQQWITRSAVGGAYNPANDTLIASGSLSYLGLAPSIGNSVRYGSSGVSAAGLYTDAIALPSTFNSGSLYYSAIVRFNGPIPTGGARTSYASFSTESANPSTDAGLALGTSVGAANVPLPAAAWVRNVSGGNYQFGSGKQNGDGMGPSASAPSWQSAAAPHPYANQQGNTSGAGQTWAGISDNTYFVVMKYSFVGAIGNDDRVSMWINPIASTLGEETGEAVAGAAGGSYYSAIDATVSSTTYNFDSSQIRSFLLVGLAQAGGSTTKSIDVNLDELRIGTTWADVTPTLVPEPCTFTLAGLGIAALLAFRRRA